MVEYFGGCPELIIPDNLKSGVHKACRYDPDLNPSYQQWAEHYQVVVIPTRPYKPQDKAKVEVAVQVVERWILARLRKQSFFSLAEINHCIAGLLEELNQKPFKQLPGNRQQAFEQLDKPALKPLPAQPYQYVDIKTVKVNIDYHVQYQQHHYSVPHQYVGEYLQLHAAENLVSLFFNGQLIASHPRAHRPGTTTLPAHMPVRHQKHQQWTPGRLKNWAQNMGASVLATLVPKPRVNLMRFHGVFAPNSQHRVLVTPARRGKKNRHAISTDEEPKTEAAKRTSMAWAQRLKRVFNIDIETCPSCGGSMKVIACIEDPVVIKKILDHIEKKEQVEMGLQILLPLSRAPPVDFQSSLFD